jgi:hypothetical protein
MDFEWWVMEFNGNEIKQLCGKRSENGKFKLNWKVDEFWKFVFKLKY